MKDSAAADARKKRASAAVDDVSMLPNFCSLQAVLMTMVIAELGAILLAVMRSTHHPAPFYDFLFLSVLMCSAILIWAAGLCVLRDRIAQWGELRLLSCGVGLAIVMGYCGGELSYMVASNYPGFTQSGHIDRGGHILRSVLLSSIVGFFVMYYMRIHYRLQKRSNEVSEAKTQALQARIRPHFLFNTLNIIAELTSVNPEDAEKAVNDLARLYRMSLAEVRKQTTLKEEVETCRAYTSIEQYRMGSRLAVEWAFDESLSMESSLPALTLQPLVENAMYHGIEPLPEGGIVRIKGTVLADGRAEVSVSNPLSSKERSNRHKGNNIALDNIRQRFKLIYGDNAELITEKKGDEFYAALRFPHNV